MSKKSHDINGMMIKLEDETDEFYSTTTSQFNTSSSTAYKGKIEVTSKGRRKIFDGVRWQILCRRPDCRKQTNKKSLCITHYKEEYGNYLPTQFSLDDRKIADGSIRNMHSGRRFIFQNSTWLPLCKHDRFCRNVAICDLFCNEHYQSLQNKQQQQQEVFNPRNNKTYRQVSSPSSMIISNEKNKRLKVNDFSRMSSSLIEQFDINSNENSSSFPKSEDIPMYSIESKFSDESSRKHRNQIDQSVQTDFTIPLCCILHQKDHSFFSRCQIHRKS